MVTASSSRRFTGDFRADVLVGVIVLAALVVAFVYQGSLTGKTTPFTDSHSGLSLSIPDNWTVNEDNVVDTFVSAYDTRADSIYKSTVVGRSFALDPDNPATLDTLVNGIVQEHQDTLTAFHLMDIQPATVGGAESQSIQYAYVTQPIDDPFSSSPPVIVIATDYVIYSANKEYWVMTLASDEKIFDKEQADFTTIINSVKLP
jgi:hypothetical protein